VFTDDPSNAFAGRDVTAIALQLPDAALDRALMNLKLHPTLLAAGIPIVEHLCGLDQLPASGFRSMPPHPRSSASVGVPGSGGL
jgi:kynurenine formamidase